MFLAKVVAWGIAFNLQLLLAALVTQTGATITTLTISAAALSTLATLMLGFCSYFHHPMSIRPSKIIELYLLLRMLTDIVRIRTIWSAVDDLAIAILFIAALVVALWLFEDGLPSNPAKAARKILDKAPVIVRDLLNEAVACVLTCV